MQHLFDRYTQALIKELQTIVDGQHTPRLATIFIGGGTPSLLSSVNLEEILMACRRTFDVEDGAEITIETNPRTADFVKLLSLRKMGINRISIGVQSFFDGELDVIERIHTAQDACDTVDWARKSGFQNINIDLMSGIPGQTEELWRWNLKTAIDLEPEHLSLYQLTVEDGTPLAASLGRGTIKLPSEDEILAMDQMTEELCGEAGLTHYEVSNYARPGYFCRHNINYWQNGEYYGVGAAAVRYLAGERLRSVEHPERYCALVEQGDSVIIDRERLDPEAAFRETVVMGLRLLEGISLPALRKRFGIDLKAYYGATLERLIALSLLEMSDEKLRLTEKGRAVANTVMAELV